MLILSGSLIGMMKKHALSYDSPLYGRRTAQIRLMPLPFTAVYAAQSLPFDQAVQQYALTGGVPKYLEFFTEQELLIDQIRSIVLSKNGFLYEEPNFLLRDEVQTPINYFSIIRVIADGNHKLGKICGVLEQESPPSRRIWQHCRVGLCCEGNADHGKESGAFQKRTVFCIGQLYPLLVPICLSV